MSKQFGVAKYEIIDELDITRIATRQTKYTTEILFNYHDSFIREDLNASHAILHCSNFADSSSSHDFITHLSQ